MRSRSKSRTMLVWALSLLSVGLIGCAKVDSSQSIKYSELMSMMNQSVSSELGQAVGDPSGWVTHNDKLWVVGHQPGSVPDSELYQLWVASAGLDGSGVSSMQLTSDFSHSLVQQRDIMASDNPDVTYRINWALSTILFDSADRPHFILYEQLSGQVSDSSYSQPIEIQFTLCSMGTDSVLQRDVELHFPMALTGTDTAVFPNWYRLVNDDVLWVYVSGTVNGESSGTLLRFDTTAGDCTAQLPLTGVSGVKDMPDGSLLLVKTNVKQDAAFYRLTEATSESPTLVEVAPLVTSDLIRGFVQPLDGIPTEDILLLSDTGVVRYDMDNGTIKHLIAWEDYGILDGNTTRIMFYYPKKATTQFLRVSGKNELSVLSLIDQATLETLPTITVGLFNADPTIKAAIHAYNAAGHDYYIKPVEYNITYNDAVSSGFSGASDMLNHMIATKDGPDIILATSLDFVNLIRKGLFVDLYPYLDADLELSREDFLSNVLCACETDGILPTIVLEFGLFSVVGDTDIVGPDMGWTWDEYNALLKQYPTARSFLDTPRSTLLLNHVACNGNEFIDKEKQTAQLNSAAFIKLLEESLSFPETDPFQKIWQEINAISLNDPAYNQKVTALYAQLDPKPVLLARQALLTTKVVSNFRFVLQDEYDFDGPVTYKGVPTNDGRPGTTIIPMHRVGISATCTAPEAAWDFVRTLLLPAYQQSQSYFPLRRDALQAMAEQAKRPDPDFWIPLYVLDENQKVYLQQGLTQNQVNQVLALIDSAGSLYSYDNTIASIVAEEIAYFYSGARTAEEAAAVMQNRVQTYLDEQG